MSPIDWFVLVASLMAVELYGLWKARGLRDMQGYLLAHRSMRWYAVAFSIMATQASAITFLSTPGQAYVDGLRFVQFYLGLPLAMVVLAAVAVPIYHRLKVYTAYEYLERRFDLKTRLLAAGLFLVQRGLAAGLTIYAPSIVLSVLLGWDISRTILIMGCLVVLYTTLGGSRSVQWTQFLQFIIMIGGLLGALGTVVALLPDGVSWMTALRVAGQMGRLRAVDFSFDLHDRYTLWSGLIGGFFLALSYFGTDQSQVRGYLTGRSVAQSRLGLLFNGIVKVPMQFFILLTGATVFAFHQFVAPPLYFNPVETARLRASPYAADYAALEAEYAEAFRAKAAAARRLAAALRDEDASDVEAARSTLAAAQARIEDVRRQVTQLIQRVNPEAETSDVNYIFLSFVLHHFPPGLVGLMIAVVFAAAMSSVAAELNALASTTVVDVYRRLLRKAADERHYVVISKASTLAWGALAIVFAGYAHRLGSLVEAVNILGSLFYGTILGIFLVAFFCRGVGGTATFLAALAAEAAVVACFLWTDISFLWYNVVGCLLVVGLAYPLQAFLGRQAVNGTSPRA
ncbi:MAG: sodium:solute symporter [Acidobacteria bacterium]|nr:sodium:solute symporter [Acidobacteriota bacterium]